MKKHDPIRVLIVDDYFVIRAGLKAIVNSQPDLIAVAEVGPDQVLAEKCEEHQPDVIVMDLNSAHGSRLASMTRTSAIAPKARFIIISDHAGDEDIYQALRAGARGFFLKSVGGKELVDGIRAVFAGQRVLPAEIAFQLANRVSGSELSPRELEILKLISNGRSNKEIAQLLAISDGTVRVHASNIFSKLGCGDRAQAVSEAFHRGIIHVH